MNADCIAGHFNCLFNVASSILQHDQLKAYFPVAPELDFASLKNITCAKCSR